jgi:hypothetical protein
MILKNRKSSNNILYVLAISVTECEMETSQRIEVSKFRIWSWLLSRQY